MTEMNFDDVLAQVRPKATTVRVCLRGDLLAEHERLEQELADARRLDETSTRHAQAPKIARQISKLEQQITEAEVPFEFAAIGQKAWTDLLVVHRPTKDDEKERYEFNPRTFPQAAVAASSVSPKMTREQVDQLFAVLNFGQWQKLWGAALRVNAEGTDVPFSAAASAVLRGSEMKSGQPGTTESPGPSS